MIFRRLRRLSFAPLVVFSAATLVASCSTVSTSNATFTVNGTAYDSKEFAALMEDLATGGQFQLTNGKINAADYAPILRTLVRYEAYRQMIGDLGIEETDAIKTKVAADAEASPNWSNFPDSVKKVVLELGIADAVLAGAAIPSDTILKSMYKAAPASTGVMCMSHILVETEAAARAVLVRLDKGEKFADVAREVSIEPAAKDSGGSLGPSADNPCQALVGVQTSYDPAFVDGAVAAKAGVPTAPVKSSFGWHVIFMHPYDDVAQSVRAVLSEDAGNTLLAGWMTAAKISLDPRYGTWIPARATIE